MPRITAPTVAEHRANVREVLLDTAEEILRTGGTLTAGSVTAAAGIARNSIYRYVDSIDGLRGQVVARYLPDWLDAVTAAVSSAETPADRVAAWVESNLQQAARSGHGWLMAVAREESADVTDAHLQLRSALSDAWSELCPGDPTRAALAASITAAIVDAGFRALDHGHDPSEVVRTELAATQALAGALSQPN